MANFKLLALTNPVAGREADFETWYEDKHLDDLLAIPGVTRAQRYKLVTKLNGADSAGFLALYDVECDDPSTFLAALGEAAPNMAMTDAMDTNVGFSALFAEHGTPRTK